PFVTGLQAPGTRSNLAAATGAWRYGKRSAFPTSPHPRRRRTNVERRVTLTFPLGTKDLSGHLALPSSFSKVLDLLALARASISDRADILPRVAVRWMPSVLPSVTE